MSAKQKRFLSLAEAIAAAPLVAAADAAASGISLRDSAVDFSQTDAELLGRDNFDIGKNDVVTVDLKVFPGANLEEVKNLGDLKAVLTLELDNTETSPEGVRAIFHGSLAAPNPDDDRVRAEVLEKIKAWRWKSMRVTAQEYFAQHVASVPKRLRPYAHEVRQANFLFYDTLRSTQLKAGSTIGELFDKMPGAQGLGGKQASASIDPAEAVARIEHKRKQDRERRRRQRSSRPPGP